MTGLVLTTAVVGLTAVAPSGAAAHGGGDGGGDLKRVRILDDCEQRSFNDAVGDGICVGDGETTFDDFLAELVATTPSGVPSVDDWEFKPTDVSLDADEGLHAVNRGGEFHTFTEVESFGGGCITEFPVLSGPQAPVPECDTPDVFATTGLPPGADLKLRNLTPGTHLFECLIHPWMRTTVVVSAHH